MKIFGFVKTKFVKMDRIKLCVHTKGFTLNLGPSMQIYFCCVKRCDKKKKSLWKMSKEEKFQYLLVCRCVASLRKKCKIRKIWAYRSSSSAVGLYKLCAKSESIVYDAFESTIFHPHENLNGSRLVIEIPGRCWEIIKRPFNHEVYLLE